MTLEYVAIFNPDEDDGPSQIVPHPSLKRDDPCVQEAVAMLVATKNAILRFANKKAYIDLPLAISLFERQLNQDLEFTMYHLIPMESWFCLFELLKSEFFAELSLPPWIYLIESIKDLKPYFIEGHSWSEILNEVSNGNHFLTARKNWLGRFLVALLNLYEAQPIKENIGNESRNELLLSFQNYCKSDSMPGIVINRDYVVSLNCLRNHDGVLKLLNVSYRNAINADGDKYFVMREVQA
ncbi:hypothetical protein [Armatimonas sp.]|uniref:hypothetical protein n=1 Tax=Armatimonas sp. TaxID=1872638 RepID=UPI00374D46C6